MKTLHWKNSPVESLDFHNSTTWSGGGMKLILRSLRSASWESLLQLVTIATTSQGAGCNVLTHVSASMCLCRPRVAHGNGEQNKVICIHLQPPNSCIQQKKNIGILAIHRYLRLTDPFLKWSWFNQAVFIWANRCSRMWWAQAWQSETKSSNGKNNDNSSNWIASLSSQDHFETLEHWFSP